MLRVWPQSLALLGGGESLRGRTQAENVFGHIRHVPERNNGTLPHLVPLCSLDPLKGAGGCPRYSCQNVLLVFQVQEAQPVMHGNLQNQAL